MVLPARIPNLLVNSASGIAIGYATNIPTHNLTETLHTLLLLLEKPAADLKAIMRVLPGPDFPTGAQIIGKQGIREAYETGKGSITIRAKLTVEEAERGRSCLVVTELPYQVNKAKLIEKIAAMIHEKRVSGIGDIRDESDREGIRIVLELKRGEDPEKMMRLLYQHTPLESTFGFNMLALWITDPPCSISKRFSRSSLSIGVRSCFGTAITISPRPRRDCTSLTVILSLSGLGSCDRADPTQPVHAGSENATPKSVRVKQTTGGRHSGPAPAVAHRIGAAGDRNRTGGGLLADS